MPPAASTAKDLFLAALRLPPAGRPAFLDDRCGPDPALRRRVDALLAAHRLAADTGENSPADSDETVGYPATGGGDEAVGTAVGPYRLLEKVGEGGMGAVYVAEQTAPVRRRVALKVIKPGMDSREVVARFEAERQALALMDHPHIARVFDGGTTPEGRPYFVMELVRGLPVTDYCDQARLPPDRRLRLFAQVCRAVQHAHHKGVIHRDLKPSNVLVTVLDGEPMPKVIDFGIAKAVAGQPLTDAPAYTRLAQMVGTPLYMAPEQAEPSAADVDTRADVYALGVLLYELLTGTTPFAPEAFRRAGFDEMRRIIREDEPPRPSHRLSTLDAKARSTTSERRGVDDRRLSRVLRGDLDRVVMKALDKDRGRRYQSPAELAADVERYLAGEPVAAHPPGAAYRLRKFAQKHRGPIAAAVLVLLALVAGAGVAGWQAVAATRARQVAEEERDAANRERLRADDEAAIAREVTEFLQSVLGQASGWTQGYNKHTPDRNLTVRVALDRAAEQVGEKFRDRPLVEAAVRMTIGVTYQDLGEWDKALAHLIRAADLFRRHSGPDHPHTLAALHATARVYHFTHASAEAVPLFERVRAAQLARVGPDHPDALFALHSLARSYGTAGRREEAIAAYEQLREAMPRVLGPDHPGFYELLDDLGLAYFDAGRTADGVRLLKQALEGKIRTIGTDHPQTHWSRSRVAYAYLNTGRAAESIPMFEQARGGLALSMSPLALARSVAAREQFNAYMAAGRARDAVALQTEVNAVLATELAPGHPDTIAGLRRLAAAHDEAGSLEEGEGLHRTVLKHSRAADPASAETANVLAALGRNLLRQKRYPEAEPPLRASLAARDRLLPDDWLRFNALSLLGGALAGQGKQAEAEPLLADGYEGLKKRAADLPAAGRARLAEAGERLAALYEATGRADKAAAVRASVGRETLPPPRPVAPPGGAR